MGDAIGRRALDLVDAAFIVQHELTWLMENGTVKEVDAARYRKEAIRKAALEIGGGKEPTPSALIEEKEG